MILLAPSGTVLATRIKPAFSSFARIHGLLATRPLEPEEGLWLKPCSMIHMIGMTYPLDLIFLDRENRVVRTVSSIKPFQISPLVWKAHSVLELAAGFLSRHAVACGDQLRFLAG